MYLTVALLNLSLLAVAGGYLVYKTTKFFDLEKKLTRKLMFVFSVGAVVVIIAALLL